MKDVPESPVEALMTWLWPKRWGKRVAIGFGFVLVLGAVAAVWAQFLPQRANAESKPILTPSKKPLLPVPFSVSVTFQPPPKAGEPIQILEERHSSSDFFFRDSDGVQPRSVEHRLEPGSFDISGRAAFGHDREHIHHVKNVGPVTISGLVCRVSGSISKPRDGAARTRGALHLFLTYKRLGALITQSPRMSTPIASTLIGEMIDTPFQGEAGDQVVRCSVDFADGSNPVVIEPAVVGTVKMHDSGKFSVELYQAGVLRVRRLEH